jgi:uncharacterized protein (DUF302 family)
MSGKGVVDMPSAHSVADTMDRLESLLKAKGIKTFARIAWATDRMGAIASEPQ